MPGLLLIILVAFALYSLFSKAISRSLVTLPIIFTALGYLLSNPLTQSFDTGHMNGTKILLGEITLILVLFADASHVRFRQLAASWNVPARMLLIGLPLSIALGTIVAWILNPGAGLAMALLTAALLTPTDAALGQTFVSSPLVPLHIKQTINVESGLNDGLVLPFVLVGAILASANASHGDGLVVELVLQLVLGPVAGIAVGWLTATAMDWVENRDYMDEPAGGVVFLCAAFTSYGLAHLIGGNGFIAAFVGGMVFANTYKHDIHFVTEFMEGAGQLLTMASFLLFGAFLLPDGLAHANVKTVALAILFLTVVRMVPILISLAGSGLNLKEKLIVGWFGPRGLASILFTLLMIESFDFPAEDELLACISLTVMLSIILHGVSAQPLARRIGNSDETDQEA